MTPAAPLAGPETALAAAVIERAWHDALAPDARLARRRPVAAREGAGEVFGPGVRPRDREEAIRFLMDDAPGWAEARAAWCELAAIPPDALRREARRRVPPSSLPPDLRRRLRPEETR